MRSVPKRVFAQGPLLQYGEPDYGKATAAMEMLSKVIRKMNHEATIAGLMAETGRDLNRDAVREFMENLLVWHDEISHGVSELVDAVGESHMIGERKK